MAVALTVFPSAQRVGGISRLAAGHSLLACEQRRSVPMEPLVPAYAASMHKSCIMENYSEKKYKF